ncbi:hypothetical protein ACFLWN_02300 [Chloroflexota bacterium]
MKKRLKLMGLAVGVATIATLTLGSTVFAETPEEADTQAYCGGYGWHGFHNEEAVCSETASELLGLTPEELCELRQEGKSLAEIAAEQGVTVDELVDAIMAEKIAAVQARVADGTLTQEQADLMIQQMAERTEMAVNRTTTGPTGWRMGGGYGEFSEGTGPGLANRWGGGQNGRGACNDATGTGIGFGGMHRGGR